MQCTIPHMEAPDFHIVDYRGETHPQHQNFLPSLLTCSICRNEKDDIEHLFFNCTHSKTLWKQTNRDHNYPLLANDHTTMVIWLKKQIKSTDSWENILTWAEFIPFLLWQIWNNRNGIIFNKTSNLL